MSISRIDGNFFAYLANPNISQEEKNVNMAKIFQESVLESRRNEQALNAKLEINAAEIKDLKECANGFILEKNEEKKKKLTETADKAIKASDRAFNIRNTASWSAMGAGGVGLLGAVCMIPVSPPVSLGIIAASIATLTGATISVATIGDQSDEERHNWILQNFPECQEIEGLEQKVIDILHRCKMDCLYNAHMEDSAGNTLDTRNEATRQIAQEKMNALRKEVDETFYIKTR